MDLGGIEDRQVANQQIRTARIVLSLRDDVPACFFDLPPTIRAIGLKTSFRR